MADGGQGSNAEDAQLELLRAELQRRKGALALALSKARQKGGSVGPSQEVVLAAMKKELASLIARVREAEITAELEHARRSLNATRATVQGVERLSLALDQTLSLGDED